MKAKRYVEHFLCDAVRLACYLGGDGAKMSDGIGSADDFPMIPREREQVGDDVRFIRVEGEEYYEIAYVSTETPRPEDKKIRNKSLYRVIFGRELKKARESSGVSLEELSKRTNLKEHSLEKIEEGRWDFDTTVMGNILFALGKTIKIV